MRRIAIRGALFLLPVLLAWGVLEWWMTHVPDSHSIKRADLLKVEPEIDTLILGSSSAFWDIAPAEIDGRAFNLANVSQTLYYDDQLLSQVLPNAPKLKRVILTINYVSFLFDMHGSDEEMRQYAYWQRWRIPPSHATDVLDPRMYSAVLLRTPGFAASSLKQATVAYLRTGKFETPDADVHILADGWSPQPATQLPDLRAVVLDKKMSFHHRLMKEANVEMNLAALHRIVSRLEARGMELILVTPPVYEGYAARMNQEYWRRTQEFVADIVRNHSSVSYYSFLQIPGFGTENFLDEDHLNERGAVEFSRLLNQHIQGHRRAATPKE
jgi:hypothetical protein